MVRVIIGGEERELSNADEPWISQQIRRRRDVGQSPWVRIIVEKGELNMALSTPNCPVRSGSNRPPNSHEKKVYETWDHLGLNNINFTCEKLIDFIAQLRRIL
jgi:hypothetical protein